MVYRKKTDSSLFLTDCEIKNNFEHLRNNMLGLNALAYICQLICFALPENFHIINLFDDILFFLNKPDIYKIDKLNLFRFYLIYKLGYIPEIKNCGSCNSVIENNAYIDIDNSEIFCKNCNINNHKIIKLDSEYIKFHNELLYLLKTNLNKFYNIKLIQFKNLLEKINSSFIMNLNFKLDKSYNLLKELYYS
jgi:DNA repair protein RecO